MVISVEQVKRVSVMTVIGRVDSGSLPKLEEELRKLVETDSTQIVLDLNGVEYLSSASLRALVTALKACKRANGDLRLCSLSPRADEVLKLAGLDRVFSIYPTQLEAVNSY